MTNSTIILSIIIILLVLIMIAVLFGVYIRYFLKKWYCQQPGKCALMPYKFGSTGYSSQQQCETSANCSTPSDKKYYCTDPSKSDCDIASIVSSSQGYNTYGACRSALICSPPSQWYCTGGSCVESNVPVTGSNPYATQKKCAASCQ